MSKVERKGILPTSSPMRSRRRLTNPRPRRARRDRSKVVAVKTTRYFIYGRGYNSELAAYMQVAKGYVSNLEFEAWRKVKAPGFDMEECRAFIERWYAERYPARPGCNCAFCQGRKYSEIPKGLGCFISKMADYRQIAREIMSGKRDDEGRLPSERPMQKALPMRSEVTS